jgi:hypothetical protein
MYLDQLLPAVGQGCLSGASLTGSAGAMRVLQAASP